MPYAPASPASNSTPLPAGVNAYWSMSKPWTGTITHSLPVKPFDVARGDMSPRSFWRNICALALPMLAVSSTRTAPKELHRAIEVNKIQGNRNPFIDYPDLVEYIWGDKQGTPVDFRQLTQSYGDVYSDSPTGVCNTQTQKDATRKEIRDGQMVIVRNASIYTTLGQLIR